MLGMFGTDVVCFGLAGRDRWGLDLREGTAGIADRGNRPRIKSDGRRKRYGYKR